MDTDAIFAQASDWLAQRGVGAIDWQALEVQGLVDDETSVASLFLTVYGSDSVKLLADRFREQGFPDVPTAWAGGAATVSWLRKMGFGTAYAGRPNERQDHEFVVPGAIKLNPLHSFQHKISRQLRDVLTLPGTNGRHLKAMVELPTGRMKSREGTVVDADDMMDEMLSLFGGGVRPVMARLVESGRLTQADIKEAERALQRLSQRNRRPE